MVILSDSVWAAILKRQIRTDSQVQNSDAAGFDSFLDFVSDL